MPTKLNLGSGAALFFGKLVQNCTQNKFKEDHSFPDS
jgi:hypothetical protein